MADGDIIILYTDPNGDEQAVDTVRYPLDAAEEVANKMLELIKQARDGLTKS